MIESYKRNLSHAIYSFIPLTIILILLFIISRNNYLVFHTLAESFSIIVAWGLFIIVWNTRESVKNDALLFLGIAYLFIGGLDFFHTISYKGMGAFESDLGANTATQLWIIARYMESISLCTFPLLLRRRIKVSIPLIVYTGITVLALLSVFIWKIFPNCFIEDFGLTAFKRNSEYIISFILIGAFFFLHRKKNLFDKEVYTFLAVSIVLTIVGELAFTYYVSVYGLSNLIGHFFKIISFYLIYKALIHTGLKKPFTVMFKEISDKEERFQLAVEVTKDGIWDWDIDTGHEYFSPRWCEIIGYSFDDPQLSHTYKSWESRIHPDDRERVLNALEAHLKNGSVYDIDYLHRHKSGEYRWQNSQGQAIFDENGKPIRMVGSVRDITDRKQVEEALRLSETNVRKKLKAITEPDGDINILTLSDIIDVEMLQPIMDDFYQLTGLAGAMLDLSGKVLVATGWQDICKNFHRCHRETLKNCIESDTILSEGVPAGTFKSYRCKNNLWETVTPITIGERHLGNLFIGQFFYEDETTDVELFREKSRLYGFDEKEYLAALSRVPYFSREKVNSGMQFYGKLSAIISTLSFSTIEQSRMLSEQKQTEFDLASEKEQLAVTLRSIGDGVISTDSKGIIVMLNNTAEKLTGWGYSEVIGKPLSEVFKIINEHTAEPCDTLVERVFHTGGIVELEKYSCLIAKDGSRYKISGSASPIRNKERETSGVVMVFSDITKEMALQEQIHQQSKMDAIGQLAGGMAHDFNNMLSGIMSSAQLLKSPKRNLDDKGNKYVDMILQASERAAKLIAKLLSFGRKEALNPTIVDIFRVIEETVSIMNNTIDKKIVISVEKKSPDSLVIGDKSRLQNVILNLCINASHAMETGGLIKITTENLHLNQSYCDKSSFDIKPGRYCKICLSDTGAGIQYENLNKIFEPFFTTKEQGKGTGLGLFAVYGTILEHNGEILVQSEAGVGTTFSIVLPSSEKSIETEIKENVVLTGSGTILLVDDEEINRTSMKDILVSIGYTVLLAEDGLESIDIFSKKHNEIDMVLMDMIMPTMNGSEAFYKMKEIDEKCKVIIASGHTKDENIHELVESGLSGFINKPFNISEISQLLHKVGL